MLYWGAIYIAATLLLGFWARRRVVTVEDFIVAGRRLPLSLAWATLLATWFGAGTVMTAADAVRHHGLRITALEPLGAGFCLLLAGWFFAKPLWNLSLLTLSDFFKVRYGRRAEMLSAAVAIPGYIGWVAVQFVALAQLLELFAGVDQQTGIVWQRRLGPSTRWLGVCGR